MSMNATAMKNAIVSKMEKEAASAVAANKKFGDAILEYIIASMDITYSWSATNTGAADPAISFKAILSGQGTLTPSISFPEMLLKLAALIKSSIVISPAAGFNLSPLSFNPAGVLTATMASETAQDTAMQNFCAQIIASLISSFPNPSSVSGTHGAFSGNTTGMVIA